MRTRGHQIWLVYKTLNLNIIDPASYLEPGSITFSKTTVQYTSNFAVLTKATVRPQSAFCHSAFEQRLHSIWVSKYSWLIRHTNDLYSLRSQHGYLLSVLKKIVKTGLEVFTEEYNCKTVNGRQTKINKDQKHCHLSNPGDLRTWLRKSIKPHPMLQYTLT